MLRLLFEAVMVIAVVSCLYFMMELGKIDNKPDELSSENEDDPEVK
jgi:hypothetical protein